MQKHILLPGLAVVCGLIGAALRRWALTAAFEPGTGLAQAGHPAMLALIGFTGAAALLFALLCRGCPSTLKGASYYSAFYAPEGLPLTLCQAAAILLGLSSFLLFIAVSPRYFAQAAAYEEAAAVGKRILPPILFIMPQLIQLLLGLVSAAAMFLIARALTLAEDRGRLSVAILLPGFYSCIWLINIYHAQASDPVVLSYAWHLFAILSVMLALYYAAGFAWQNVRPRLTVFFSLSGVFFSLATLPDPHSLYELFALAAFLLWLLCTASSLLRNLSGVPHRVPGRRTAPRPATSSGEDDDVDIVL